MALATQPAASGTTIQTGLWKTLLTAIVVFALAVGFAMAMSAIARPKLANTVPTADRSYDRVEEAGAAGAVSAKSGNLSDDQIQTWGGGALSVGSSAPRYDNVDSPRVNIRVTAPVSATPVDRFDNAKVRALLNDTAAVSATPADRFDNAKVRALLDDTAPVSVPVDRYDNAKMRAILR